MLDPIILFISVLSAILLLGVFGEIIFRKTGVPDALWLVLAGILLGPLLGIVDVNGIEVLRSIAPFISPLALIVILFGGSTQLKLKDIITNLSSSSLLGIIGFIFAVIATIAITEFLSMIGYLENWSLFNGLLVGAMIGGTSSIVVIPSLLHLKNTSQKLKSLLSLESSFSDVLVIVFVISLISIQLQPMSEPIAKIASSLAGTFSIGIVFGAVISLIWVKVLSRFKLLQNYLYMLTFAVLLAMYAGVEFLGGSGAISILAFGIIFGNYKQFFSFIDPKSTYSLDKSIDPFQKELSFFVKTFFFVLIGLLFTANIPALSIGALLAIGLLGVRFIAIKLLFRKEKFTAEEKKIAIFSYPRGLAAAVMAILPASLGLPGTESFQGIVFSVILFTILIFTLGMVGLNYYSKNKEINPVKRKLKKKKSVKKTSKKPIKKIK